MSDDLHALLHRHCLRKPPHEAYYDCDSAYDGQDEADDVAEKVMGGLRPGAVDDCDVAWDAAAELVGYILAQGTPEIRYRAMAWVIHRLVEAVCA